MARVAAEVQFRALATPNGVASYSSSYLNWLIFLSKFSASPNLYCSYCPPSFVVVYIIPVKSSVLRPHLFSCYCPPLSIELEGR